MLGSPCVNCCSCCCSNSDSDGRRGTYFEDFFAYSDGSAAGDSGWSGILVNQIELALPVYTGSALEFTTGYLHRRTYLEGETPATITVEATLQRGTGTFGIGVAQNPQFFASVSQQSGVFVSLAFNLLDTPDTPHRAQAYIEGQFVTKQPVAIKDPPFRLKLVLARTLNQSWNMSYSCNNILIFDQPFAFTLNTPGSGDCFSHGFSATQTSLNQEPKILNRYYMKVTYND